MTDVRRSASRALRATLARLGLRDVHPGPRTRALDRRAFEEAGLPYRRLWSALPGVHVYPRSLARWAGSLPGDKVHDYGFLGSLFGDDVRDRRRWVLDFARAHFTPSSLLVATDAPDDYEPLGPFDRTREAAAEHFRPRDVEGPGRLHVDEGYFRAPRRCRFTLCPAGDCPWSMRFFEAVMCGSLPIVERHRHTGRNVLERRIGYRYLVLGMPLVYRPDWVRHNERLFRRRQTLEGVPPAARLRLPERTTGARA